MRSRLAGLFTVLSTLVVAAPAAAAPVGGVQDVACASGGAARAAVTLYGDGTELVRTERVAGLRTALVMEPYIAPGTRQRMVAVGSRWCDAASGLNRAWRASGRKVGDGRALAAAYARLAAAPYFDDVRVTSHSRSGATHTLTTHAKTNGVVAEWTILVDALGVRTASWTATKFAVKPFVASDEGLTALPGAEERYTRAASGLLAAARGLPKQGPPKLPQAPGPEVSYTTSDGFKIIFSLADSNVHPDLGMEVGESHIDAARIMRDLVGENMEEFLAWGMRSKWDPPAVSVTLVRNSDLDAIRQPNTGYVYVNDSLSLYCFACVFIADDFNIHILSDVGLVLSALGYTYPEGREREALSDVLGHEIMHNFQNSYVEPEDTDRTTAGYYSEGTARFSETLHSYAQISHQQGSLVYADDANGCNGYHSSDPTPSFARGPFTQSYSACNFWMTFYGMYGQKAFVKAVAEGVPRGAGEVKDDPQGEVVRGVEIATGRPMAEASAAWARAIITGKNLVWGPIVGSTDIFDWGLYLEKWTPDALAVGSAAEQTLGPGGVMAAQVVQASRPVLTWDTTKPGAPTLWEVRDTAAGASLTQIASNDYVYGPKAGEKVYVLAARGGPGDQSVKISMAPGGTPPAPKTAAGTPSAPAAAPVNAVACKKAGAKALSCTLTGFAGTKVDARLLRGKRTIARGASKLRGGAAKLRLRGTKRLPKGKASLVITVRGNGLAVVKRTITVK